MDTTAYNAIGAVAPIPLHGSGDTGKITYYANHRLDHVPQLEKLDPALVEGIRLAALVFPFKVNSYVLDTLIDWEAGEQDPIFRLVFPHPDMLLPEDLASLRRLRNAGDPTLLTAEIMRIRDSMNPHSSNQLTNIPIFDGRHVPGMQHKYQETTLFFAKQGQTCHSYCTFCFRWPQFVKTGADKFEADDGAQMLDYLRTRPDVSDLLMTGGDPMVMTTRRLTAYLEPLLSREFDHIRNIRIGTKAITYNPQRFVTDKDANELLALIARLADAGKHVAVMAHVNHWRELEPEPVHQAIAALRNAGAVLRTQSPVLRHINDDASVWSRMWKDQVELGMVPYYMFMERDTGAHHYFGTGVARALSIYQDASAAVSGICKTARGPVMSAGPGKIHVLGRLSHGGREHFILSFLQARKKEWLNRPFLADYSETARWLDDLTPSGGDNAFFFTHEYQQMMAAGNQAENPAAHAGGSNA
ncbi:lysine 2,3-aminomutase [Rhizobium sp. BK602]|uniref:KamA family radical SAM protein n=1 Tax=Rhizobium sp. BK602 TaxID=2586986 RepID=UPI001621F278|nr:lysine 2,3-aminomutase [Rhizobium sp. BK602]MBB3610463.1 KamA family protein [Rhizobium sp. BK602]